MGFTKTLSRWIVDLRFEDLPAAVVPWTKAAVTDYFAVALAGCPAEGLKIVRKHVWSQYATGEATIIGDTARMSAEAAALFNGTMAHWEEYDDATFGMAGHPSVVTMPALFVACELQKVTGRDFITAFVAAVEVCAKLGRLITPQTITLGYHPTAIIGTLAAAAAVGKVWKFDAAMMENALGLAATHSCGLRPHLGRMAKPLHAGLATRGGMASAMLARDGFVGAPDLIEDPHGFAHAFSGGKPGDYDALAAKIGKPLEILDPGLAFKIFPSNFHTQAGVVAVLQMMREDGVKGDDVESVRCLTNHMTQHSLWNDNPQTGLEGKLSLHYCLAAALTDGQLEVEQFHENRAQDPKIRALFKRITLEPHPSMAGLDFTKGADFLGMEVVIKLKNGKTVSRHIKSGFSVPAVDGDQVHADLVDKFVRNAKRVLPQANIDDCLARIKRLESLAALDDMQAPLRHRGSLTTMRMLPIAVAVLAHASWLAGTSAFAQAYPAKPIRMIVTFPAGSGADIVARTAGQKMTESLGQQVVIDNRAGAGGIIGADLAAKAVPDGYTIVMVSSAHTINASMYSKLPYDPEKDFAPITMLASTPYLLVAHPSVPVKNVAELIALAKAKPGQINYASGGIGVGSHLAGELLKTMTGVDIVNVPYKGAPQATADVVGGQVQLSLSTMPTALPLVRAGRLRALAVTSLQRVAATPDIPTIAETVPGFDVRTWQGLLAPRGTPQTIIAKLREHAIKALAAREVAERLSTQGYQTVGNTPQEFAQIIKSEIARWISVVKAAGIKPIEGEQ